MSIMISNAVDILACVLDERKAQDAKWGKQDHPVTQGFYPAARHSMYKRMADNQKVANDLLVAHDQLGWDAILVEEVYEALAESDPHRRVAELIQVAAVALAEVDMHVRRLGLGILPVSSEEEE